MIDLVKSAVQIETSKFKYGSYPFSHFNKLQSVTFDFIEKDNNLVVAAPTSSGKTIVAEQMIAKALSEGRRALILLPLKALSSEKIQDWTSEKHFFSKYNIEILTGDYKLDDKKIEALRRADVLILTSEMLDSRSRYLSSSDNNNWLKDIGILVVDEAHLLTTNRGSTLEVGLMRFSEINTSARIILLSATMSNVDELGKWLTILNNRETDIVYTEWRPVDLTITKVECGGGEINSKVRIEKVLEVLKGINESKASVIGHGNIAKKIIQMRMNYEVKYKNDYKNKQTLIFVHGKEEGKEIVKQVRAMGLTCEFHCADLNKFERDKVEKDFKEKNLQVLVATSTLAWGINLPCRWVVISGVLRGYEEVEALTILQMAGRSGRFGMYDKGDTLIVSDKYMPTNNFKIESTLKEITNLNFHIIAELYSQTFKNQEQAFRWYSKSFAFYNSRDSSKILINLAFKKLLEWGMIEKDKNDNNTYIVSSLGKIARDCYINPQDIHNWNMNFEKINNSNLWNKDSELSKALTEGISSFSLDYIPKKINSLKDLYLTNFFMSELPKLDYQTYGSIINYRLKRSTGHFDKNETIKRECDTNCQLFLQLILRDLSRTFMAIKRIEKFRGFDCEDKLNILQARITYSVSAELIELIQIPGVGEATAKSLFANGIKTIEDLKNNKKDLSKYIKRKNIIDNIISFLEKNHSPIDKNLSSFEDW